VSASFLFWGVGEKQDRCSSPRNPSDSASQKSDFMLVSSSLDPANKGGFSFSRLLHFVPECFSEALGGGKKERWRDNRLRRGKRWRLVGSQKNCAERTKGASGGPERTVVREGVTKKQPAPPVDLVKTAPKEIPAGRVKPASGRPEKEKAGLVLVERSPQMLDLPFSHGRKRVWIVWRVRLAKEAMKP